MVRCKFVVTHKVSSQDGTAERIILSPVYSGSEENKAFFKATPGGTLDFYTINKEAADQLQVGKAYYIDLTEAPA